MSATTDLSPTTELEAVNAILESIGEAPVASLDTALADVALALSKLRQSSRALQARGWWFNQDFEVLTARNVNDEIVIPQDWLSVSVSAVEGLIGVQRSGKLWDVQDHTFAWTKDLKLDITYFLSFTDIPEAARRIITCDAALAFAPSALGASGMDRILATQRGAAWAELLREDTRVARRNMFRSPGMAPLLHRLSTIPYRP